MRNEMGDDDVAWTGTAISGVTFGSLLTIWSGLGLIYLLRHPPEYTFWTYVCVGLLLTGLAFLCGGLTVGLLRQNAQEQTT